MTRKELTQEQYDKVSMENFLNRLEDARFNRDIARAKYMPSGKPDNYETNSSVFTDYALFWDFKQGDYDWSKYSKVLFETIY